MLLFIELRGQSTKNTGSSSHYQFAKLIKKVRKATSLTFIDWECRGLLGFHLAEVNFWSEHYIFVLFNNFNLIIYKVCSTILLDSELRYVAKFKINNWKKKLIKSEKLKKNWVD